MAQLAPGVNVAEQVVVGLNWVAFFPVIETLLIVMRESPELVKITVRAALGVFRAWSPNETVVGERVTRGPLIADPDSDTP